MAAEPEMEQSFFITVERDILPGDPNIYYGPIAYETVHDWDGNVDWDGNASEDDDCNAISRTASKVQWDMMIRTNGNH